MHIESSLRDIDADKGCSDVKRSFAHGMVLPWRSDAPAWPSLANTVFDRATVRALAGAKARRLTLRDGLKGQGVNGLPRSTTLLYHRLTPIYKGLHKWPFMQPLRRDR